MGAVPAAWRGGSLAPVVLAVVTRIVHVLATAGHVGAPVGVVVVATIAIPTAVPTAVPVIAPLAAATFATFATVVVTVVVPARRGGDGAVHRCGGRGCCSCRGRDRESERRGGEARPSSLDDLEHAKPPSGTGAGGRTQAHHQRAGDCGHIRNI